MWRLRFDKKMPASVLQRLEAAQVQPAACITWQVWLRFGLVLAALGLSSRRAGRVLLACVRSLSTWVSRRADAYGQSTQRLS